MQWYNNKMQQGAKSLMIGDKLTFMPHLENIIKKTRRKLHTLNRIKCYMCFEQNKLTMTFL